MNQPLFPIMLIFLIHLLPTPGQSQSSYLPPPETKETPSREKRVAETIETSLQRPSAKEKSFTPNLTAIALDRNQSELTLSGNFRYNQAVYNFQPNERGLYQFADQDRQSTSTLLQYTLGVSDRSNLNLGLDVNYSYIRQTSDFHQLAIGPRVRWRPFGALDNGWDLTLQNSVWYNTNLRSERDTSTSFSFINQLFVAKYLEDYLVLIFNGSLSLLPKSYDFENNNPIATSIGASLAYFPRRNTALYTTLSYGQIAGNVPWASDLSYYRRGLNLDVAIGGQLTFVNTFSVFAQHAFNVVDQFGLGANAVVMGVRYLVN